jgi:hypothetical protein
MKRAFRDLFEPPKRTVVIQTRVTPEEYKRIVWALKEFSKTQRKEFTLSWWLRMSALYSSPLLPMKKSPKLKKRK